MKAYFGSNRNNYVFKRRKRILNLTEGIYAFHKEKTYSEANRRKLRFQKKKTYSRNMLWTAGSSLKRQRGSFAKVPAETVSAARSNLDDPD